MHDGFQRLALLQLGFDFLYQQRLEVEPWLITLDVRVAKKTHDCTDIAVLEFNGCRRSDTVQLLE